MDSPREVERLCEQLRDPSLRVAGAAADKAANTIVRLQAEVAALKERLRRYTQHHPGCSWYGDSRTCTCGLDAALARGGQG